jgi:hypothetical protein
MKAKLTALSLVVLLAVLLLAPCLSVHALTNVYKYSNAVSGRYYVLQGNYDVFYLNANGNRYWLTVYKWDANQNYIIFYSPISGTLYFLPSTTTKPILQTLSWFDLPNPPYPKVTINFPSPWNVQVTGNLYSSAQVNSKTLTFSGGTVTLTYSMTITAQTYQYEASFQLTTSEQRYINLGTAYTAPLTYSYFPSSWSRSVAQSAKLKYGANEVQNKWATRFSGTTYYACSLTYNNDVNNPSITTASSENDYLGSSLFDYWKITVTPSGSSSVTQSLNYQFVNNVLTAPNGYTLENLTGRLESVTLPLTLTSLSFALQSTVLNVSLSNATQNGFILLLDTSADLFEDLGAVNPIAYIEEANRFYPIAMYRYLENDTLIAVPCALNSGVYTVHIIWKYPFYIGAYENITTETYTLDDILNKIPVEGNATIDYTHGKVVIEGIASMYYFVNKLIQINGNITYNENAAEVTSFTVNDVQYYYPKEGNVINGTAEINSITEYVLPYLIDAVDVGVEVASQLSLRIYSVTTISLALGLYRGSWGYRIPIYVSFHETPVTPSVTLRLTLPLGIYIRQGILSPSFEDLLITDTNGNPLPYFVAYWKDIDTAVVYVKYPGQPTSSTLTLYMLIYNRVLWGTGNSYQSLSAFDFINPRGELTFRDPVCNYTTMSTYGVYNFYVFKNYDEILFASTLTDGIVVNPVQGKVTEYHGSWKRNINIQPIITVNELTAVLQGSKVHLYADGTPQTSLDLSEFFPANVSTSIYYVGWSGTTVYVGASTFYSYSVGNILGGQQQAPRTTVSGGASASASAVPTLDFWTLMPIVFILIVLAVVARLMRGGGLGARKDDMLSKM